MNVILATTRGQVVLTPEQPEDADFLYTLFHAHTLPNLAGLDNATRQALIRMQFVAQTNGYRTQFPNARFDIMRQNGVSIGRLIVDKTLGTACIVDFALLPAYQDKGFGTAILASVLAQVADEQSIVRCKVMSNNTASLRMCQRLGFVHTGGDVPFLQLEWRWQGMGVSPLGNP